MKLDSLLSISISEDRLQAVLRFASNQLAEPITLPQVLTWIRGRHAFSTLDEAAVAAALQQFLQGAPKSAVIALGEAPVHGIDGYYEWSIPELDEADTPEHRTAKQRGRQSGGNPPPAAPVDERAPGENLESVNFYQKSRHLDVAQGQALGVAVAPTPGTLGRDVYGNPLPAHAGKPLPLTLAASVVWDETRTRLTAACPGRVVYDGKRISVERCLDIPADVDFSQGAVDFQGTVGIGGSIRDLFAVRASERLDVQGTIEGAEVWCGGDITVTGGIAQRGKGSVTGKRGITTKFMDNAVVRADGGIRIAREALNSSIHAGGDVTIDHGKLAGGELIAGGNLYVAELGSEGGVNTLVKLGIHLLPENDLDMLQKQIREMETKAADVDAKIAPFIPQMKRLQHERREALTELMFRVSEMRSRLGELQARAERIQQTLRRPPNHILVYRMLHPGATVHIGHQRHQQLEPLRGPLKLWSDGERIRLTPVTL